MVHYCTDEYSNQVKKYFSCFSSKMIDLTAEPTFIYLTGGQTAALLIGVAVVVLQMM